MPPAELFMEVPFQERRAMLYRDLERGDAVVGRINNIREYGFFLTLLCAAGGLRRDIQDLEVSVGRSPPTPPPNPNPKPLTLTSNPNTLPSFKPLTPTS